MKLTHRNVHFSKLVAEFARIQVVESACRNSGEFRYKRVAAGLVAVFVLSLLPSMAMADGGTIRFSERKGEYQITIFTAPTLLRAGTVDVSVLIQNAATQQPVSDVPITIKTTQRGDRGVEVCHPATIEAATNKLFRAATFDLPEPGWWEIEASIDGPLGETQACFDVEVAEPLPPYLTMWAWIGWPVLPIVLFGFHQFAVHRASRPASARPENVYGDA
jgi:hypothetical protein